MNAQSAEWALYGRRKSVERRMAEGYLHLDRPLYVRGETTGNLLSLGALLAACAVIAPLLYVLAVILINLYMLTQLHDISLL